MFIPRKAIDFMAHWAPRLPCERYKETNSPKGEWVSHKCNEKSKNVVLYLHGGGYLLCSPATHRNITSHLSKHAECRVFALDYTLAPEKKYPTALNEAFEAYVFLLDKGYKPENISVAGDSAGGNLTLSLISKLIEEKIPVPSSIVCISPWCDLSSSRPSIYRNRKKDPLLPFNRITEAARMYSGPMNLCSPKLSPVNKTSFEGFPPTLFHTGELEILEDEMKETFSKLKSTSKNISYYKEWKGAPHVFQLFAGLVPESSDSIKEMAEFMKANFS